MGGLNINTGGGGLVIGDGGVASGVGGSVNYIDARAVQLSKEEVSVFISTLSELKTALVQASVTGGSAWAARVNELEQTVLLNEGRILSDPARNLLAKIRFQTLGDERVGKALARVAPQLRRRGPPAEVFVSYNRRDRERVIPIVQALRTLAVRVWIDDELTPGNSFTDEICEEIDECSAQLVCWSHDACSSDWVRGEAEIGRRRGVLLCTQLEPCRIQPPFNMLHAEDLSNWRGDGDHRGWSKLLAALSEKLNRPGLSDLSKALHAQDVAAIAAWCADHQHDPFGGGTSRGK